MQKITPDLYALFGKEYLGILVMFCRDYMHPEQCFSDERLADWAKRNGYIKQGEKK